METNLVFHRFPHEPKGPPFRKLIYSFEGQGVFDTWPCLVVQPPQSEEEAPLSDLQVFERERVLSFTSTRHPPHLKGRGFEIRERFQVGVGLVWKDLEGNGHFDYAAYPVWKPRDPDYRGVLSRGRLLRAMAAMQWLPAVDIQHGDRNTFQIAWGLSAEAIQPRNRSFYEEKLGRNFLEALLIRLRYYRPEQKLREELGGFLHRCHVYTVR